MPARAWFAVGRMLWFETTKPANGLPDRHTDPLKPSAATSSCVSCPHTYCIGRYTRHHSLTRRNLAGDISDAYPSIMRMLTWDIVRMVVLANVLAIPFTYYAMGYWLSGFAYRVDGRDDLCNVGACCSDYFFADGWLSGHLNCPSESGGCIAV